MMCSQKAVWKMKKLQNNRWSIPHSHDDQYWIVDVGFLNQVNIATHGCSVMHFMLCFQNVCGSRKYTEGSKSTQHGRTQLQHVHHVQHACHVIANWYNFFHWRPNRWIFSQRTFDWLFSANSAFYFINLAREVSTNKRNSQKCIHNVRFDNFSLTREVSTN